jgi:hypothetical protein
VPPYFKLSSSKSIESDPVDPFYALALIVLTLSLGQVMADNQSMGVSDIAQIAMNVTNTSGVQTTMKIHVTANGKTTVFELNNSQAAKELYVQLPLKIKVENYSDNEKIFYPPKKLNTTDTPQANARTGTLAYYAPWGDVVMFFDNFGSTNGLYELGHAVTGSEYIKGMTGTIQIEKGT